MFDVTNLNLFELLKSKNTLLDNSEKSFKKTFQTDRIFYFIVLNNVNTNWEKTVRVKTWSGKQKINIFNFKII